MAKDPARAIRSAISQSKKIPLNYGYCLGIDPWEAVWLTHKKKTPATLARQARREGNTPKTIYGVMTSELNVITLTTEVPPPGRVTYNIKYFLKEFGLAYKIRLIGPDGEVYEDGGDDDDDTADPPIAPPGDAEAPRAPDGARPDPALAKWQTARGTLAPKVAAAQDTPRAADIRKLWTALNDRADGGDPAAALKALPAFVKLLSENTATPATLDPALVTRFKAATADLKARIAGAPAAKPALMAAFAPARAAVEGKDNAALATSLPPLEAAIASAQERADIDPALATRYRAATGQLRDRIAAHPGEARLMALFKPAQAAFDAKDPATLAPALDALDAALAEPVA